MITHTQGLNPNNYQLLGLGQKGYHMFTLIIPMLVQLTKITRFQWKKNDYIKGKSSYAQVLKSNLSQTESEPDISLLCEDGTSQTSPLCKKIYTAELISSPVQVHQSEDSVQEQPTEPSSPFHPQLIQQSTAVPNFPSSGNAIIDNSIVSIYNVP